MDFGAEQLSWNSMWIFLGLLLITLMTWPFDKRKLDGSSVWAKPIKFELALAVHFGTLGAICHQLSSSLQTNGTLSVLIAAASLWALFEITYIIIQAARQQRSHFNLDTPFLRIMYFMMAVGALVITVAAAAVGLAVFLDKTVPASFQLGAGYGLLVGAALTLITAFRMGGALSHHVGIEPAGAPRMFLTGWSLTVGDRRIPHFFATHLMQFGPVLGWIAQAHFGRWAVALTAIGLFFWTATVQWTFRQANLGKTPI